MKLVDGLPGQDAEGFDRKPDDLDEVIAGRVREASDDVVAQMFWATYEKARDRWWAHRENHPPAAT